MAGALALAACVHEVRQPPKSPIPAGKILVLGEVAVAGLHDHHVGMTLLDAIRASGGLSASAAPDRAMLTRFVSGMSASVPVHLDAMAAGREPDVPIEDGDILQVPSLAETRSTTVVPEPAPPDPLPETPQ